MTAAREDSHSTMGNIVEETYNTEFNLQKSALDTGIEDDTSNATNGICWEASDEDTKTATLHSSSFNQRDFQVPAEDGISRYTLSGRTDVIWEPEDDTQTEQTKNGTTNDKTTPGIDGVKNTLSNVFTSIKYKTTGSNARLELVTHNMSDQETSKKKEKTKQISTTKQIATRMTSRFNGVFIGLWIIWTLLSTTPVTALPRPPGDNHRNIFASENMTLGRQHDMNYQGLNCRPQISAKTLPEDDFQQIECQTSTCPNVSRIVFEKTGGLSTEWLHVFEGYNKTHYQALNTKSDYTLKNRTLFSAFRTKHLLYIQPLRLDDRGKWRCVVYDTSDISYTSMTPLNVNFIYVTPTDGNVNIQTHKLEIVTGQATYFTCILNGVFPKPTITWEVNSIDTVIGISSSRERDDKLWSMENMVELSFDKKGENIVKCKIKTDKRNPWIQQLLTIDVKEAATILTPINEKTVSLQENSMVNLECVGYGYKPNIHWRKDGEYILDSDSRYHLKSLCNESTCVGSIETHHIDSELGCDQAKLYSGEYSCVISLEELYNSTKISPKFNVIMPDLKMCNQMSKSYDLHFGLIIGFSVLSVVLVIVAVQLCIMIIELRRKVALNMDPSNAQEGDTMLDEKNGE